jgi:nicotinamide-nucleotide amidase
MIEEVMSILKERGARVATAESCTGGRIAAAFTENAGASEYFLGGVVAYDNEVKIGVLGVSLETLQQHGAVSRQTAEEMAQGVRRLTGADFAISTTGIAGPGGGSPEKPVGTVWIAVATPDGNVAAQKFNFNGKTRTENMANATTAALELLRKSL